MGIFEVHKMKIESHHLTVGMHRETADPLEKKWLKVPKREIFDRSDFPDFYTIKPPRVGDFGVKIKTFYINI